MFRLAAWASAVVIGYSAISNVMDTIRASPPTSDVNRPSNPQAQSSDTRLQL